MSTPVAVALVSAAAGVAVLMTSPPRVTYRILAVCGGEDPSRSSIPVVLAPMAVPFGVSLMGGLPAAIAAAIIVTVVLWVRRRRLAEKSRDRRSDDLLLALSLMIAELSVGAPPVRACEVAVAELRRRDPGDGGSGSAIADGLEAMACRAALGGSVLDSTSGDDASAGGESWRRIGVAWQIADDRGLPMGDLLGAVRSDLQARRGFADRTRAGLSGPRATAAVLAGLPLLGIALGQATGAGPIQVLLGGGLGGVLLVVGCGLVAAGIGWSERITGKVLAR
ncbi:type II secretion system protein F [Gordonia McavH-238-E]|uniref:type II secretion system F family protein n=1 Tax=unclassified Gordonia (in: high G+C Gram-positive bacteria) TaxID=2657482 RepID=UPI001EF3F934|nr:type II secretion system protein F [Gordonia sp. McavH-238-E]MCG7633062.1 type II secretion system protein F [Gordonia sp. McavH-238-E]